MTDTPNGLNETATSTTKSEEPTTTPASTPAIQFPGDLRDYFAAHASKEDVEMAVNRMSQTLPKTRGEISVGEARYNHADHMLAARRIPATQPEGK